MKHNTTTSEEHNRQRQFQPDANESQKHREAKRKLAQICKDSGMQVELEVPVKTEYKTYYCDVLATLKFMNATMKLDLEVEDYDSSKHDFADADNKVKELERYFIRTIWFKSVWINSVSPSIIFQKILEEMQDGQYRNPRFNL